jgi:hypothetical protein
VEVMSVARVAVVGLVFGSTVAFGWMGAVALRAAWAITVGERWYQLKQL